MTIAPLARRAIFAILFATLAAQPAFAQARAEVPWAAGENLQYTVRMAGFKAGTGFMQVAGIDTMRGRTAWKLHFNIKGSALGYHVDDTYESWMDAESLNSLRFEVNLLEGGKKRQRNYDIFPSRSIFHQEGKEEEPSVPDPLDDASFFFFVRTMPLIVGKVDTLNRYFDPKANPVIVKVVRKDTITVPAGRFPAVVLQPSFNTNGLFSKNGNALIWLSDDEHRILLRMDTHFSVIKLGLTLQSVSYGSDTTPPPRRTR